MSSIFRHILVPVDFAEKNAAALDVACDIASHLDSRVTLLHVIETIEQEPDDKEMEEFYATLETGAVEKLTAMTARFEQAGVDVGREVIFGKGAREIVQYSIDQDVDLMVLSSHKINLEQPANEWGTLSYQVSILCQCPALLVK